MDEYTLRTIAADVKAFADACIRAHADLCSAAYDLRECFRFYADSNNPAGDGADQKRNGCIDLRTASALHGSREAANGGAGCSCAESGRNGQRGEADRIAQPAPRPVAPVEQHRDEQPVVAAAEAVPAPNVEEELAQQQVTEAPAKREVKSCSYEHVLTNSPKHFIRLPNTDDVLAILNGQKEMLICDYYAAFKDHIVAHNLARINQRGMRYLAYSTGAKRKTLNRRDGNGFFFTRDAFVWPE